MGKHQQHSNAIQGDKLLQAISELSTAKLTIRSLKQELSVMQSTNNSLHREVQTSQKYSHSLQQENLRLTLQLKDKDRQQQQLQQLITTMESMNGQLQQQVTTLQKDIQALSVQSQYEVHHTHLTEFWEIPRDEVTLDMRSILGAGGWGYVVAGKF